MAIMTPRDAFGVAVRVFGLVALFYGIQHLFTFLSIRLAMAETVASSGWATASGGKATALIAAGWLVVGALIISGANTIVNTCYPLPREEFEAESSESQH